MRERDKKPADNKKTLLSKEKGESTLIIFKDAMPHTTVPTPA